MPGNPPAEPHPSQPTFLSGGGGMGERMRALDWSATPLGPVAGWPEALRSATSIMLNSRFPIALYWGEELALLYNDAWGPIPGGKHPWALGQPGRQRPRPGPAGLDRRRRPVAARLARARRPAGAAASTPGFGSRLIERGLAHELDGRVRLDYASDGVVCKIDMPLPQTAPQPV